ncbi:MAG: biopolymer transporter ExbD [bacterium]|nr:biopolymer transporter ExbD [bacterium]
MHFAEKPRRRPAINITSLIDVLFLLLTFFLVTTSFIEESALKVELPSMKNADRAQQEKRFVLEMGAGGEILFDGEALQGPALEKRLAESAAEINAAGGLVLRADQGISHGKVMGALDQIKAAGIQRFLIATEEKP